MRRAVGWFVAAVAAVPVTVFAHECGHLAAAAACGLQGLELHYASTNYSLERPFWSAYRENGLESAAAVVAPWKVGAAVGATWGRGVVRGTHEAQLAAITGVPEGLLLP